MPTSLQLPAFSQYLLSKILYGRQDELRWQLEAMRGELTQLEADLSSKNTEAAKLSRALADARANLGGSDSAAASHSRVPGSIQVKLGAQTADCMYPILILWSAPSYMGLAGDSFGPSCYINGCSMVPVDSIAWVSMP